MNPPCQGQGRIESVEASCGRADRDRARGTVDTPRRSESIGVGHDVEMRNRVVQANLGLVHQVARRYVNRGLTMEDLVGEGNLGLIRAAQAYDPSQGTRFSTYAYYWIREAIQSALASSVGTIRLPMNISRLLGRWRRTEKALCQLNGHPPTFEEVAAAMDLDRPTQRLVAQARLRGPAPEEGGRRSG